MKIKEFIIKHVPWIAMFSAFLFLILGGSLLLLDWNKSSGIAENDQERYDLRGKMGDFYGGHLAAFSGLAASMFMFAGLFFQMQELKLQREDNKESREIFAAQKKVQEKQVELMELAYEREYVFSFVRGLADMISQRALIMASDVRDLGREKKLQEPYTGMLDHILVYTAHLKDRDKYWGLLHSVTLKDLIFDDENKYPNAVKLKRDLEQVGK